MKKIKYWIYKLLFKKLAKEQEQQFYKMQTQIDNLKKRLKYAEQENERYRLMKTWLQ